MANVLVINGSERTEKGHTAFLLAPFIEGMQKAGAKVDLLYTTHYKILPCIGCFKCWGETIGECFIKDAMQELYPKLKHADLLVLATPVYIPLPGNLQNFINRLCPLIEPLIEFKNGRTRAKFHDDVKITKILGIITGGWWEIGNLDVVHKVLEEIALNSSTEFVGPILRPHVSELRRETEKSSMILSTLKVLGEKFINEGILEAKDLQIVSQPLVSREEYIELLNKEYLDAKEKQFKNKQ